MSADNKPVLPGLSESEQALQEKLLSSPLGFPLAFKNWLKGQIESDVPALPLTQMIGYTGLSDSIAATPAQPVTGQITSGGAITAGTGFTVNHSATGTYVITFTTAFSAAPTVVVTVAENNAGTLRTFRAHSASTTAVTVLTLGTSNSATDAAFNFVAFTTV